MHGAGVHAASAHFAYALHAAWAWRAAPSLTISIRWWTSSTSSVYATGNLVEPVLVLLHWTELALGLPHHVCVGSARLQATRPSANHATATWCIAAE